MARPPSARAHRQVLDAALTLFAERGIDATSMDAIAEASGVSKATIYKHWPDKDALCLEAMAHLLGRDQPRPVFDTGDVRADMVAELAYQPPREHSDLQARIMPHLIAYAARNPAFGEAWRARVFEPPRAQLTRLLERAIAQGQLPRDLDRDLAIALLLGPMLYIHVLKRIRGAAPEDLPEHVVAAFWKAHAIVPPPEKRQVPRARRPRHSQ
jgi:AcrR family transcriptional regulator